MENLMFCLNATGPIFSDDGVWTFFFARWGILDEDFANRMNKFVFKIPLPFLLFSDLASVDFSRVWNIKFIVFCFVVTLISITISTLISCLWRDKSIRGEFIQASYRSSAALLGIAFIQNIYGEAGMEPLMIVASVPLYNIMAVVVLTVMRPERGRINGALIRKTLHGIITNPIIVGILTGVVWSVLKLPMPVILEKTVKNVAVLATPLGSATTDSSYVMARNMGHKGVLTSSVVMLTTLLSAFTLTGWLYLLKVQGLVIIVFPFSFEKVLLVSCEHMSYNDEQ